VTLIVSNSTSNKGLQSSDALVSAEQVRLRAMSRLVDDQVHLGLAECLATDAGRSLLEEGHRKRLARLVEILGAATPI